MRVVSPGYSWTDSISSLNVTAGITIVSLQLVGIMWQWTVVGASVGHVENWVLVQLDLAGLTLGFRCMIGVEQRIHLFTTVWIELLTTSLRTSAFDRRMNIFTPRLP